MSVLKHGKYLGGCTLDTPPAATCRQSPVVMLSSTVVMLSSTVVMLSSTVVMLSSTVPLNHCHVISQCMHKEKDFSFVHAL